jgi:tetratricopeptide (TPR) repeat protein
VARALNNIAILLYDQGDLASAKAMYEQALGVFREVGNKFAVAAVLNNIGNVLINQRDLEGAKRMHEEALAIRREIGDRSQIAFTLHNLAGALAEQGDLAGAKKTYQQLLDMRREMGEKSGVAYTLNNLGEVLSSQGDLVAARKTVEEALAIRKQLGVNSPWRPSPSKKTGLARPRCVPEKPWRNFETGSTKEMRYPSRLASDFYVDVIWNKLAKRWQTFKCGGNRLLFYAKGRDFRQAMRNTLAGCNRMNRPGKPALLASFFAAELHCMALHACARVDLARGAS